MIVFGTSKPFNVEPCLIGTAASWNQLRMTVDELEKLQFLAAEKARQVGLLR